jgi:endonuclease/exonuclease/phosphatase family metal-dependent hydrolase
MVLQGRKGIKLAMIPCAHSTSWKAQQEILLTTHDTRDPREVALQDVMKAVDMLGDNVRIILAGDFNLPWNEQGRNGPMDATEKKLSKLLNTLCEIRSLTSAWGALHPDKQSWTRQTSVHAQAGSSHIDHIIVSQCLIQSKAITRIGILQDEQVGSSDHRLLVMEYDPAIALNLEEVLPVHRRPKQIAIVKAIVKHENQKK